MRMFQGEVPLVKRTDRYEIRIYFRSKIIKWYRLRIRAGVVVPDRVADFTLDEREFALYKEVIEAIKEGISKW